MNVSIVLFTVLVCSCIIMEATFAITTSRRRRAPIISRRRSRISLKINRKVNKAVKLIERKSVLPLYTKTIAQPVCPRPSTASETTLVQSLKTKLNQKTSSITRCSVLDGYKKLFNKSQFHDDKRKTQEQPRYKRGPSCNSATMSPEEQSVIDELDLDFGVIPRELVCIEEITRTDKGVRDVDTNTLNMCASKQYRVTLISFNFMPYRFTHYSCGNGDQVACLCNEGACVQTRLTLSVFHFKNLNDNAPVQNGITQTSITVTTGCNCEIINGSVLEMLV